MSSDNFTLQIFSEYQPITDSAYDGEVQNVGDPVSGDMAAAWWTGKNRQDTNGMWSEPRRKGAAGNEELDRDYRVQIDFDPTHFRPKTAK